ncbi:MAG TPA: hypothetical protein VGP82_15930 [Ktedonobacterales bacterium]|nr:hypothetical protein [Ktedonobacterales bacterium]
MPRLERLSEIFTASIEADAEPENFVVRLEDILKEAAADGAVLVEVRFGGATALLQPHFLAYSYEAARRVRERHPALYAEALYTLLMEDEPARLERVVAACIEAGQQGLSGIDLLYNPYAAQADWRAMYRVAGRCADAGLGITAHAGEFATATIVAALQTPGLTRLGHAVYAASDPLVLDLVAKSGVTVECSLTCNVVLGAVRSYKEHPIREFVEAGAPVALCTDNPVQLCTTIGHEYALAAALDFQPADLLNVTTNAIRARVASPKRKALFLTKLAVHKSAGSQALP